MNMHITIIKLIHEKIFKFLVIILFMVIAIPLYAHEKTNSTTRACYWYNEDSLLPVRQNDIQNEEHAEDLFNIEKDYNKTGNNRKALVRLLRALKLKKTFQDKRIKKRVFKDLANVSARLKLYPLAMKCYYKTQELNEEDEVLHNPLSDSSINAGGRLIGMALSKQYSSAGSETASNEDVRDFNFVPDNPTYEHLINMDTLEVHRHVRFASASEPIAGNDIRESFHDGKTDFAYALIVHVKQPVPGRRRAFAGINNVGHMFITLIKYNDDNSTVSRSFGFYPDKTNSFSATPLHPGSLATFKDDAFHDWDEVIGKFISYKRFEKIIRLINRYDNKRYHLNQNNCTDFGLNVAEIGGIDIMDTQGNWPLGRGNNPANAGQSILEGKFSNMDTDDKSSLFLCSGYSLSNP